ncbi:ornithine cyclodeaminase family protein [Gammaproteobacteria bacterium]|nr:ornithine cyclodeaminase family protein [Gammaproteobacteria bacterium]
MMPITLNWKQIEPLIRKIDISDAMREAFVEYSKGNAVIPPVGELIMDQPRGEVHIKYGYIKGGDHYVIKIASGFPDNEKDGIKPGQGMMLLFSIKTGEPEAILIDDANLTDIRTAIAGAIASHALSNQGVESVAIVGTGVQARYQARYISELMQVKKISIWGRDSMKAEKVKADLSYLDVSIETDIEKLVKESSLIVTTTSSKDPLIQSEWVKRGTHITAVGSDTPEKCELDPNLLSRADLLVADSLEQNLIRGEIHQAAKRSLIDSENVVELGEVFSGIKKGRLNQDSITIADLTGVAVQDLIIAQAVFRAAKET